MHAGDARAMHVWKHVRIRDMNKIRGGSHSAQEDG
jgi:hypothetical protein